MLELFTPFEQTVRRSGAQTDRLHKNKSPHSQDAVSWHHEWLTLKRMSRGGCEAQRSHYKHDALTTELSRRRHFQIPSEHVLDVWYFSAVMNASMLKEMVIEKYCIHLCLERRAQIHTLLFMFIWTHYFSITMIINKHGIQLVIPEMLYWPIRLWEMVHQWM